MKINKKLHVVGLFLLVSLALAACGDNTMAPGAAAAPTTAAAMMTTSAAMTTNASMTTAAMMTTPAAMMTTAATMTTPAAMTTSMAAMTTPAATSAMASMTMMPGTTMAAMTTPAATMAGGTTMAATTAAASSGKVMMIDITNFKFATETLTVPVGTKIIWTNKDSAGHTVTSDAADGPLKSPLIDQGKTFEYTFDKAGTYEYHCEPHPFMKGKIIVTA